MARKERKNVTSKNKKRRKDRGITEEDKQFTTDEGRKRGFSG